MKQIIPIADEESWLTERLNDITSTEISALYGLSPYISEFELFHTKKDKKIVRFEETERMRWGKRLESSIAQGAAAEYGWDIAKMDVYMRDTAGRLGSSFDFKINSQSDGAGLLEVKNVDYIQYQKNWIDDGDENIEAPEHIELQLQHQMEVADMDWGIIVALVGGNTHKTLYRNRDKDIGQSIRNRVAEFWKRIETDNSPDPDYEKDARFIIKQLRSSAKNDETLVADSSLEALVMQYQELSKEVSAFDKLRESIKAHILDKAGCAGRIVTNSGTLSIGEVKPSIGTLITQGMVGTYVGARRGYRNFRFSPIKGK